jgi:hypothetical protein
VHRYILGQLPEVERAAGEPLSALPVLDIDDPSIEIFLARYVETISDDSARPAVAPC